MESIQISDSRLDSTRPRAIFPSPTLRGGAVGNLTLPERWIGQHIGDLVHIVADDIPVSGRLLGIYRPPIDGAKDEGTENHFRNNDVTPTVFIASEDRVISVLLKNDTTFSVASNAHRNALSVEGVDKDYQTEFPIFVTASGNGEGILEISYETILPGIPSYEMHYNLQSTENIEVRGFDDHATVECTALVANPLHVPLNDVKLRLTGRRNRGAFVSSFMYDSKEAKSQLIKKSTKSRFNEIVPIHEDGLDLNSGIPSVCSTIEKGDGFDYMLPDFELDVPGKITLPVDGSARIPLYSATCRIRMVHITEGTDNEPYAFPSMLVENKSEGVYESGIWRLPFPGNERPIVSSLPPVRPGDNIIVSTSVLMATIEVKRSISKQLGRETVYGIKGDELQTRLEWTHLQRIDLHNRARTTSEVHVCSDREMRPKHIGSTRAWMSGPSGQIYRIEDVSREQERLNGQVKHIVHLDGDQKRSIYIEQSMFEIRKLALMAENVDLSRLRDSGANEEVLKKLQELKDKRVRKETMERNRGLHIRKRAVVMRMLDAREALPISAFDDEPAEGNKEKKSVDQAMRDFGKTVENASEMISLLDAEIERVEKEAKIIDEEMMEVIDNLRENISPEHNF